MGSSCLELLLDHEWGPLQVSSYQDPKWEWRTWGKQLLVLRKVNSCRSRGMGRQEKEGKFRCSRVKIVTRSMLPMEGDFCFQIFDTGSICMKVVVASSSKQIILFNIQIEQKRIHPARKYSFPRSGAFLRIQVLHSCVTLISRRRKSYKCAILQLQRLGSVAPKKQCGTILKKQRVVSQYRTGTSEACHASEVLWSSSRMRTALEIALIAALAAVS